MFKKVLIVYFIFLSLAFVIDVFDMPRVEAVSAATKMKKKKKINDFPINEIDRLTNHGKKIVVELEGDLEIMIRTDRGCSGCRGGAYQKVLKKLDDNYLYISTEIINQCTGPCEMIHKTEPAIISLKKLKKDSYTIFYPKLSTLYKRSNATGWQEIK